VITNEKLAVAADKPGTNWKGLVVGFTVGQYLFSNYLEYRQYRVFSKPAPPVELKNVIEEETFVKTQSYGKAKSQFSFVSSLYGLIENLAIYKLDILPKLFNFAGHLVTRWAPQWASGLMSQSIVFMFALNFVGTIASLPLSIYQTFVLEEKFGFNKQTPRLFLTDLLKTQLLSIALGAPMTAGALKLIDYFGDKFFFYLSLLVLGYQVVLMAIYPTLIQPLFNKLEPLEEGELKTSIENLAKKVNFPLTKIYVIDGSKRSSHSNAYFMGLPWSKQIVLYDTLIEKSTIEEVTAVLAHEIGHWHLWHIPKLLGTTQAHLFAIFSLFSAFIKNKSFYNSFGFYDAYPILVGFILFNDLLQPLDSVMSFFMNLVSRTFEYQADSFAAKLNYTQELGTALIGIHKENLSAVDVDWLYSSYHRSHPTLAERLRALEWSEKKEK
jgi:STE24 endopeptidase